MGDTIDKVLYTSIIAYILTMMSIIVIKPSFMYDKGSNKFKSFGTDKNETLLPISIIGLTSCILIYLLVIVYTVLLRIVNTR